MPRERTTVFTAMSGGVDSSMAAALLVRQKFDVAGVFIRGYNVDGCAERDAEDARRAAEHLGIPFYVFDLEKEYRREVVDYMIEGYRKGITPNPDVMCNKRIKFGLFFKMARALGADAIATGHYVRRRSVQNQPALFAARDENKDQSYFLWTLTPDVLAHCIFPIGDYTKPEVRRMAKRWGLPTAEKKDSQGICFLGKVSLRDFLKERLPEREGAVVTAAGEEIGTHRGAWFYTVGQRHIGVANAHGGAPYYIAAKNVRTNTLVVAEGRDHAALFKNELRLADVNMIRVPLGQGEARRVFARVRYRQPLAEATLSRTRGGYALAFKKPQKFVAAGQSAVFYETNGELLGGGVIK